MSEPTYDGVAFAQWLKRWKDHDGRHWGEIAHAAGLSTSTFQLLIRGRQQPSRGKGSLSPSAETLARIAHAFGLETSYVMAKAGLDANGSRWASFTREERLLLMRLLSGDSDYASGRLHEELLTHHTNNTGE